MHGLDSVMDLQLKSIDTLFMRIVFPFFWNFVMQELDPPPWLNRMQELGYPPGYLGNAVHFTSLSDIALLILVSI